MKKKKEIEIPKTEYIYQRYNGIITKYIVDKEYYIAVGTGIATKKDETVLLGKVSDKVIDLVEVGDIVNNYIVLDVMEDLQTGEIHLEMPSSYPKEGSCEIYNDEIEIILTHEQHEQNCYKLN